MLLQLELSYRQYNVMGIQLTKDGIVKLFVTAMTVITAITLITLSRLMINPGSATTMSEININFPGFSNEWKCIASVIEDDVWPLAQGKYPLLFKIKLHSFSIPDTQNTMPLVYCPIRITVFILFPEIIRLCLEGPMETLPWRLYGDQCKRFFLASSSLDRFCSCVRIVWSCFMNNLAFHYIRISQDHSSVKIWHLMWWTRWSQVKSNEILAFGISAHYI